MFPGLDDRLDRCFEVPEIVHRIKYTKYINTVFRCLGNECLDYVVRVMSITEQVLPAQQHLDRGVW